MRGRRSSTPRSPGPVLAAAIAVLAAGCSDGGGQAGSSPTPASPGTSAPPPVAGADEPAFIREWSWEPAGGEWAGMPAADDDAVAVTVSRHLVVLLDSVTGAVRWEREQPAVRDVAPALTPDRVVVPTDWGLVALDRGDGQTVWEAPLGDRASTPAVAGDLVVAALWDGALVAVDAASGELRWKLDLGGQSLGTPAVSGDTVVATWDSGRAAGVVAVEAAGGARRWEAELPPDGVSGAGLVEGVGPGGAGVVAVVAGDVAAHGFGLRSGQPLWRVETPGAGSPELAPVASGSGSVVLPHRLGGLMMVDPADGSVEWDVDTPEAAVRGGLVGPSARGTFALTLWDGSVLVGGPHGEAEMLSPPSLISGVAATPSGWLVVATGQGPAPEVTAVTDW